MQSLTTQHLAFKDLLMRKIILPLLVFGTCLNVVAQNNGRLLDQPMTVKSLSITVKADPFTATSFIEMEFYNPNSVEEEGLFRFELKPGQAITAFQLDLNGKFRDGTIEERWKAANAYNTIVGKRVDPALLQMEYYNHYSLRIYPLPPKGSRRISMTIQQALVKEKDLLKYVLPLDIKYPVEKVLVNITVSKAAMTPSIPSGLLAGRSFTASGDIYLASLSATQLRADKDLEFNIPLNNTTPVICARRIQDRTYFALRYKPNIAKTYTIHPKKITVYWDVSINGAGRDTRKEITFLRRYIAEQGITQLTIIPFSHYIRDTAIFYTSNGFNSRWTDYLESLQYEGAAQLGILDFSSVQSDLIFLFSDGINSYGSNLPKKGKQHVFTIHAAGFPHVVNLTEIVGQTGGRYIDLKRTTINDALKMAGEAENTLLKIRSSDADLFIDPGYSIFRGEELLIGGSIAADNAELVFEFGNHSNAITKKLEIKSSDLCASSSIERISALSSFDSYLRGSDWQGMLEFGKLEGIVTLQSAYIVLERIEDYIRYNIMPPKELEGQYDTNIFVKQNTDRQQIRNKASAAEVTSAMVTAYNKRLNWWAKSEISISTELLEDTKMETFIAHNDNTIAGNTIGTSMFFNQGEAAKLSTEEKDALSLSEVVITSMGVERSPKDLGFTATKINYRELNRAGVVNFQNGLTGKVSGLNVQTLNNGVFADTRITLRGIRSLTGNNQPMLVVDGVPISLGYLSSINPNDILSVTILKSPSATSLYGSDGVNGALIVQTMQRRNTRYYYNNKAYRLKDRDDVDYLADIISVSRDKKLATYKELKKEYYMEANFYLDMAQHLFESGFASEAMDILYSAAGISHGDPSSIKAIGYTLENWKKYEEAIHVYKCLLEIDSTDIYTLRDLALAYYQAGKYQEAVDLLYQSVNRSWEDNAGANSEWKASMLQDMNAIIAIHKDKLDISKLNNELIRPIPVDLRIRVESSRNGQFGKVFLIGPDGTAFSTEANTVNDNILVLSRGSFQQAGFPTEFLVKDAKDGKYKIRLEYPEEHGTNSPALVRVVSYRNFGSRDQEIKIENCILNNQAGLIDIAEIKLGP
jgi:TonB-dependent SusC/RagA subfamily outer membrane receptor